MSNSKSRSKAPLLLREKPRRLSKAARQKLSEEVIRRLKVRFPDAACELYYETRYQLLVSVVLSAQTTDKMVNKCMRPLYQQGLTPQDVLKLGEKGLFEKIRSIGFAPTKSKNILKLTRIIMEKHGGNIPDNREDLEALPGVGRKTANVILGEIFRHPTLAVDTHVFRVTRRLGFHDEDTPEKCEKRLLELIDPKHLPAAHHLFIMHGRYVCKARRPLCERCVLCDICPSLVKPLPLPDLSESSDFASSKAAPAATTH